MPRGAREGSGEGASRAVIFDLWDTLVPLPQALRERAASELAAMLGAPLDSFSQAWRESRTIRETGDLEPELRRICANLGLTPSEAQIAGTIRLRRQTQEEAFLAPRPDPISTLRALRVAGYLLGLISNCTTETPAVVQQSPLAPFLDAAVYSCSEGTMKPDASLYLRAASQLGVRPQGCIYVGDGSDDELEGARSAGMRPVHLLKTDEPSSVRWDGERVGSLSELVSLLTVDSVAGDRVASQAQASRPKPSMAPGSDWKAPS
jgi:putative hydrolase of the HAD superfamily